MTNIDQFESVFKAADKPVFQLEDIHLKMVMLVSDLAGDAMQAFAAGARRLLGTLDQPQVTWSHVGQRDYDSVEALLVEIDSRQPDLIVTYRTLREPAIRHPHSLGVYVDIMTQATPVPVLLLPHPGRELHLPAGAGTPRVMAITDHLAGDHHLVSYAAQMTESGGRLILAHVEDVATFERYLATISKIPSIDTDNARDTIRAQLLKEPHDYTTSCAAVLRQSKPAIEVVEIVTLGHRLADYKALVQEHQVCMLVMNTKDDEQLAMHGMAYPLAVELRTTPLLLL